jgi:predicted nucleotidyltransferase
MRRAEIIDCLSGFLRGEAPEITVPYLFGSVARREHDDTSDVDVAVLYDRPQPRTLEGLPLDLEAQLERLLGRTVQVISLDEAPPDLVYRVLRDGHLLLDRDPSKRIQFEVKARNEYFDLLPILRRYRRQERAAP